MSGNLHWPIQASAFSEREIEVLGKIGQFFLNENDGLYEKTERLIRGMGITEICLTSDRVTLHIKRPGLFVGRKGATCEKLKSHLGLDIQLLEVKEDILDYLIPQNYSGEF